MRRAAKRGAKPRRTTPTAEPFEPWQEDAAEKFGVSVSVVAEHFRPEDVTRLERVFKGRTLETFPLAQTVGEGTCFLRAFTLPGIAVPFLIENLFDAIAWWESMADATHRAVGARDLQLIARQGKRLAASLRSIASGAPSVLDALFWEGEEDAVARADAFLVTLDEIARRAGGEWCFPQYTPGEHKEGLEWAVCLELALHGALSAYRDGITARVLRFAYEAAGVPAGSDPSRVLRAKVKLFDGSGVALVRALRSRLLESFFREPTHGDPYGRFSDLVVSGPAITSAPPGRPPV